MATESNQVRNVMWHWLFRRDIDQLEAAYRSARNPSDEIKATLEREWAELEELVRAGEASFYEEDESGQVVYDYGDRMSDRLHEVEAILKLVREAFTISLSHYWEREMNKRLKVNQYDEKKAITLLKSRGLFPDELGLKVLRLTSNVAKHSGGTSAQTLNTLRPGLFDQEAIASNDEQPDYTNLLLTDEIVAEFFEVVRKSGP
ncbi:hypothetical protein [Pararhizobium gei]|uniref:hypothetical protein n=1 Tax=Pararhizobium gei TaxID=1395951 RepID=UPI0023DA4E1C|nr:hypothetical protein [Rhizobium gei]